MNKRIKNKNEFNTDEALLNYLNDISRYCTLSREEERQLAIKCRSGDRKAKERLINANLKFVVKIALNYQNRGLSLSELISDGNLGLIRAIEKYDPDKNIKLITYAVWWIRQKMLFAIAEKSSLIRVPVGLNNKAKKLKNAKDKRYVQQGYLPDSDQLSKDTEFSEQSINLIANTMFESLSIDDFDTSPLSTDPSVYNYYESSDLTDQKTLVANEKLHDSIMKSIEELSPRESFILKSYFGLDGYKEMNFTEIGIELGISREHVRQIQIKVIKKIFKNVYPVKVMSCDLDLPLYPPTERGSYEL